MEEALKLVEQLIEDHKRKVTLDSDITIQSQDKGYRYALEDVRDEIKAMITMKVIQG